jgi:carboxypeptidase T
MKDTVKFYYLFIFLISLILFPIGKVATQTKNKQNKLLANIQNSSEAELIELDSKYDIWHVDAHSKKVLIFLSQEKYERLKNSGFYIELEEEKTRNLIEKQFTLSGYRTVEEIYTEMANLSLKYPDLVELIDYGDSWEKTTPGDKDGYDLYALKITNKHIKTKKPPIVIDGGIHAREMTPPEVVLQYAYFLLENYNITADISWLVDYREIHIVPMMNPDGRKLAEQGYYWRKNTNNTDGCLDSEQWGVDLNRNYPFKWGIGEGSSFDPCSQTFRGSGPESEPEIYNYLNYVRRVIPDQKGTGDTDASPDSAMGVYLNCHSYGNVILHPWGWTSSYPPNIELVQIAEKMAILTGYDYRSSLYAVNGVARDWAYGELGCVSYTLEMGEEFFQPFADVPQIIEENIPMFVYMTKIADHPFLSIWGPDITTLELSETEIERGDSIKVTATISDQVGMENIVEAEIYVVPVGDSSFETANAQGGMLMRLSDGLVSSFTEQLEKKIETTGFEAGKYYIFVRGKDTSGSWGSFTACYLKINTATQVDNDLQKIPESPLLIKSYPNPFNDYTNIEIGVVSTESVKDEYQLSIYNINGQLINRTLVFLSDKSNWHFSWPQKDEYMVPGLYFIALKSNSTIFKHKLLLVR